MSDTDSTPAASKPWFNDKTYNAVKFAAQIGLPALGTLYAGVAGLWGLPATMQVIGTIVAVDTFLGVILGISAAQYNAVGGAYDGTLDIIHQANGDKNFMFNVDEHPANYEADKGVVTFKVSHRTASEEEAPGHVPPVAPPTA